MSIQVDGGTASLWSFRINVATVAMCTSLALGGAAAWFGLENRVGNLEASRTERRAYVDAQLANLDQKLRAVSDLPYRVTQVENTTGKLSDQLLTAIDTLNRAVANLNTQIQVSDGKLDLLTQKLTAPRR